MSSHQNSAFHGESAFELAQPPLGRYQSGVRAARPQVRPSPRISHAPDEIWGHYNNYRSNGVVMSAIIHVVLLGVLLSGAFIGHEVVQKVASRQSVILIAPSPESYALPTSKKVISGGGGGGDHDRLPAPKGQLPKTAMQQITPPAIIVRNEKPKLAVEPTVVVPPQVHLAENHMPSLGVSSAAPMPAAPPSNGTGSGGGIGGGVYKVGGGISAPQAISSPDPDYTEEARRAKKQGTCVLWLIVDAAGHPRDIKVVRGLGLGLDAKALEAVQQWRFQPALKDGKPVDVQISVEVEFHLY
jgi:TonB family protein